MSKPPSLSIFDFIDEEGLSALLKLDTSDLLQINEINKDGDTLLILAIETGLPEVVSFLLKNGADVNLQNSSGRTPLMVAIAYNNLEIAQIISDFNPNLNLRDDEKTSALTQAVRMEMTEMVEYLVKNHAKIDHEDNDGNTAFMNALLDENFELAQYLLDAGANINYQDNVGNTALMQAAQYGKIDTIKFLLEHDAKSFFYNINALQAFDLTEDKKIKELLLSFPQNYDPQKDGDIDYDMLLFHTSSGINQYSGFIKRDTRLMHGQGILFSLNENRILEKGNYENGLLNGFAIYYLDHIERVEGKFKDGIQNGEGEKTLENKEIIYGNFVNGFMQPQAKSQRNKSDRKIILIRNKESDLRDTTGSISANYQMPFSSVFKFESASDFKDEDFEQYICKSKSGLKQIIFNISSHGSMAGELSDIKLVNEVLEKFLEKIIEYNQQNAAKINHVKLNLNSCYGDACVENSLYPIIQKFVENGINVRTSAIKDLRGNDSITDGKNFAAYDQKKTTIVERLYTQNNQVATKWYHEKSDKYQYSTIELKPTSEVSCSSGCKVFPSAKDLLEGNYVRPKPDVRSAENNALAEPKEEVKEK